MTTFFGKYRGKVVDNTDPLMLGRLIALVPAVSESPLSWAMPCVPYAGKNVGFFALPPIAANVWIEFEAGDPNHPIWTGCFWDDGEVPVELVLPTTKVIKTETVTLEIDDLLTSVSLQVRTPDGPVRLDQGPDGIALTIGIVSLNLTIEGVNLTIPSSTLSVGPVGISLKNESASADIMPDGVSLSNGDTYINLDPTNIEIKNGTAIVELTPVTLSQLAEKLGE